MCLGDLFFAPSLHLLNKVLCGVGVMVEIKGRKFTVILRKAPEGNYSAQCLELPGAMSEGENRKEALANIKEAIESYLEAFPEEVDQLKRKKELVEITV
jgi:predicted RNase H-like HicB family nuclease